MTMAANAKRKKPASSRKAWLLIAVVLLVAVVGLPLGYRFVTAPWSFGYGGRDTLTRSWVGPMQAKLGAQYGLYLDLDYRAISSRGRGRSRNRGPRYNLQGRGAVCSRTGDVYEYTLRGKADRSGTITTLWMEYGDPRLSALNMYLKGPWKSDALTVTSNKNPFLPDGRFEANRSYSSSDPDDSFAPAGLQPGDRKAFDARCASLRGAGAT